MPKLEIGRKWKLRKEVELPGGMKGVYGLAECFQVAQNRAAVVINLRRTGKAVCDFELGNDIFLFDTTDSFTNAFADAEPLTFLRSFPGKHPIDGSDVYFVRYDGFFGFVPEGEKLPDGRPHPHAGTGFCLGVSIAMPAEVINGKSMGVYDQNKGYFAILTQVEYKDGTLREKSRKIMPYKEFFPGAVSVGLTGTIPDGEDFLIPFSTVPPTGYGQGLLRMKRGEDGDWHPADFEMIDREKGDCPPLFSQPTDGDGLSGCEPSAARVANGDIVFTCREWGPKPWDPEPLDASRGRIWVGCPGKKPFRKTFEKPYFHTLSPISVGATWNGTPFLLANEYSRTDWKGKVIPSLNIREKLLLYPLAGEDCLPQEPLVLCDAIKEFGDPGPTDGGWFVDHPMASCLRLEGKKRNFISWRVFNVEDSRGAEPSQGSAAWIAEIIEK